jgi:hypothetical protein
LPSNGRPPLALTLTLPAEALGAVISEAMRDAVEELRQIKERLAALTAAAATEPNALLLKKKQAARYLAMSPSQIDNLRRSGELPSIEIDAEVRFSREDLQDFANARRVRREKAETSQRDRPGTCPGPDGR